MNSPPCYAIIGPPRSGGNLVTRILRELGVYVGERFHPPNEWQPDGFLQDLDFEDAITHALGSASLHEMPLVPPGDTKPLEALVAARRAAGRPWGFKHPKTALVLAQLVASVGPALRLIRTTRALHASVLSYKTRAKCALDEAILAVGRHEHVVSEAIATWPAVPSLTVAYESLVAEPADQVARLAAFVGLPVTPAAVAAVKPQLNRFGGKPGVAG